jgi:hypothetical protein
MPVPSRSKSKPESSGLKESLAQSFLGFDSDMADASDYVVGVGTS